MVQWQLPAGKPGEQLGRGLGGTEPAKCGLWPLGDDESGEQQLQPAGVPAGVVAEERFESGDEHAACATATLIEPVLVSAGLTDRVRSATLAQAAQSDSSKPL